MANVCSGCRLRFTKIESAPDYLQVYISRAAELDEIKRAGGTFSYPEALEPSEWVILTALERGRNRAEAERTKAERRKQRKR